MSRLVVRSGGRASSLGWLGLALVFGVPFIAVGLEPGTSKVNLLIGVPVFLFFVGLAFWDLGRSEALVLDRVRGRARFLRGWYHLKEGVEFDFVEASDLVLFVGWVGTGRGGQGGHPDRHDLRVELRDGRSITMELGSDAEAAAVRVAGALGLPLRRETRRIAAP